ncbi:beta-1,6-N-acetylglucosaminyltransferase [Sphingobacterium anhuiense]|uniref:beta-1,6-N-acetylglucosaminyltransferase n=1 Tax=Sphingobacterium anhuiense TaxID=493780 RepID=UPI003C2E1650
MFKNAFLIICHKNELQVCELIKVLLQDKNNYCIVFCDLNFSILNAIKTLSISLKQVQIIHSKFKIQWGTFSMVHASLILLEKAYSSRCNFKYYHLISGQDFPIKPIREINSFFKKNNRIYLDYFKLPRTDGHWSPHGGLGRYIHNNPNKHAIPHNISCLYGGSQWWSITREATKYIFNFLESNPSYFTFYYKTFVPDESFFHTILVNSDHLKKRIINNNLRYIDWISGPNYPRLLTKEDFKKIIDSDYIFARKMEGNGNLGLTKLLKNYIK